MITNDQKLLFHSTQTLAVWVRKKVIQVFAGFFCEAKLKISLQMLEFTGMPVNSNQTEDKENTWNLGNSIIMQNIGRSDFFL